MHTYIYFYHFADSKKTEREKAEDEAMMEELTELVMKRDQLMWQFDEDKNRLKRGWSRHGHIYALIMMSCVICNYQAGYVVGINLLGMACMIPA